MHSHIALCAQVHTLMHGHDTDHIYMNALQYACHYSTATTQALGSQTPDQMSYDPVPVLNAAKVMTLCGQRERAKQIAEKFGVAWQVRAHVLVHAYCAPESSVAMVIHALGIIACLNKYSCSRLCVRDTITAETWRGGAAKRSLRRRGLCARD